jgi:chemotaxis protein methyltransferase CheR
LERGLINDLQQKYFVERERKFWIHQAAKNLIDFRRLNLIHPFGDLVGMDMVLCRNVLIYFDDSTRRTVTEQLTMCLAPGGMLMLGAAESIAVLPPGIVQEQFGRTVVFRKSAAK